jgi:DNA-binding SARP family transcriptional activator
MRFTVLGSVALVVEDQRHTMRRAQTRGLLALLLLHVGRPLSQEAVVDALWGGAAPQTARAQVQSAVSTIRGHLAAVGAPPALLSSPAGYRLALAPEDVDVCLFDEEVRLAGLAAGSGAPTEAVGLLRTALGRWTGDPLADAAGAYVEAARARLAERRLAAVEDLAEYRLALGQHTALAAELAPILDANPMRERLRGRLMLALYRAGRQVEALRVFREYRELLAEREGLDPGDELAQLQLAILRRDPALARSADGPDRPTTLGAVPVPALLPPDIVDLTGRAAAVDRLRNLLGDATAAGQPRTALVVAGLTGMAGIGKTTLATHVAHQVADAYPDGQLYVDLRGGQPQPVDPADVLARFLRALGVDSPIDPIERMELYRTRLAGRRVLVVLDDAASEAQVRPLLPGSAGCAVLVTRRSRLAGLEGVHWTDLDVFDPADAVELLARVADRPELGGGQSDAFEIARLCGYLPLALRIAGARLAARPTWRPADLGRMLRDERCRLDLLTAGDLSVRAAFALSYNGLSPTTRRLFQLLGPLAQPGFPARLAATLLDSTVDEATGRLEELVDARLLDSRGVDGYRFHDLVRLFARERAELEEPGVASAEAVATPAPRLEPAYVRP